MRNSVRKSSVIPLVEQLQRQRKGEKGSTAEQEQNREGRQIHCATHGVNKWGRKRKGVWTQSKVTVNSKYSEGKYSEGKFTGWLHCWASASGHSLGFEDVDLGSSPGWWAATVAAYCPSRLGELPKFVSSKPCEWQESQQSRWLVTLPTRMQRS